MADWIKATTPPETTDWVIGMTQDGTVYPVVYKNKVWLPVFRGGAVESLMHGRIVYWQEAPKGYEFVTCDHHHRYLQTPENPVCPLCKQFGFLKEEEIPFADPTPVEPTEEEAVVEESPKKPRAPRRKKE